VSQRPGNQLAQSFVLIFGIRKQHRCSTLNRRSLDVGISARGFPVMPEIFPERDIVFPNRPPSCRTTCTLKAWCARLRKYSRPGTPASPRSSYPKDLRINPTSSASCGCTPSIMSMIGFARRPTTLVLPMCSTTICAGTAEVIRLVSAAKRTGYSGSYGLR
jgi:hypothetical protein